MCSNKMAHINLSLDEVYEYDFECKYRNHNSILQNVQYLHLRIQASHPS